MAGRFNGKKGRLVSVETSLEATLALKWCFLFLPPVEAQGSDPLQYELLLARDHNNPTKE